MEKVWAVAWAYDQEVVKVVKIYRTKEQAQEFCNQHLNIFYHICECEIE